MMFSYGSGLAASMFLLKVQRSVKFMSPIMSIKLRLNNRIRISATEYDSIMLQREKNYGVKSLQI